MEEIGEQTKLGVPLAPFLLGHKKVISDVAEEFDFHDVDFLHGDSGHFSPGLVRVGVVVQDYKPVSSTISRKKQFKTNICFLA